MERKQRRHPDLHPADLRRRLELARLMRQWREKRGLSVRDLGALIGVAGHTANVVELNDNWQFAKLQRHADALGLRLLALPAQLVYSQFHPGPWEVALMFPEDAARSLEYDRMQFKLELVNLRSLHRLTQADVGARMGLSARGITTFERRDGAWVTTMQRYARACNDELLFGLEELETGEQWHVS